MLKLTIGQFSDKGVKETNQDFHGALMPDEPQLSLKGAVIALADGISSSAVSRIAAEMAVKAMMTDYFCTSEAWTVKTSAQRVINATNSWLYAQTRRSQTPYDRDKGYVTTLSVMVVKSATAHLFHIGDSRIYRLSGTTLEQLTEDHRVAVSREESYLARALGMGQQVEIDYRAVPLEVGDTFFMATDGVFDFLPAREVCEIIRAAGDDFEASARVLVQKALENGSTDNLTCQIVRIEALPPREAGEHLGQAIDLPPAPLLEPRQEFEGYRVLRSLHSNSRSHIYLVEDIETGLHAALKVPSLDLRADPAYLKRFMMEEWIARRLNNAHVLKPIENGRKRNFLYVVSEFVEGQTLAQWMIDNPRPDLETVRGIVEQIALGLRAFHRKEMLHQDLRPANIMIDKAGTVKILDFGSTRVAGVMEAAPALQGEEVLGTLQYTAPEYFTGDGGTNRSDLFSLGVITYQMLTGRLPYGARVSAATSRGAQRKLKYASACEDAREIPPWLDATLAKACAIEPEKRYPVLSEFLFDLRNPNRVLTGERSGALIEKNPNLFWKLLSLFLAVLCAVLAFRLMRG